MGVLNSLLDALFDIRTERAIRSCAVYACCLSIYFFWNYSTRISPGVVLVTPSELYWAIILVSKFSAIHRIRQLGLLTSEHGWQS